MLGKKLRVAIIGCGNIAQVHVKSMIDKPYITIAGFVDCALERAQQFATTYGGCAYTTLEALLEQEEIDVVHICTPHYLHVPMAKKCLELGIHVYMEKPCAISLDQYEELYNRLANTKVTFGISYQNRYNPSVSICKELLASEKAGKILGGRAMLTWARRLSYYTESDWRGRLEKEGGGCLINQSIHTLDLLAQLLGRPKQVSASMANHHLKDQIEVEDTVEAYILFENEQGVCPGVFYATTGYCVDSSPFIEIACENMTIRMEAEDVFVCYKDGTKENRKSKQEETPGKKYWGSGHLASITDFYDCILTGREYRLGIKATDESNRLMLSIYEAAREKKTVYLS